MKKDLLKQKKDPAGAASAKPAPKKTLSPDPLGGVRSQLQTLLQALPDVVYFKDALGRNLIVNKAFEDLAGAPAEDIIGKTDEDLLPADLAAKCRESDERTMGSGAAVRFEERSIGIDGRLRDFETIKAPIFDEGHKVAGLVGVSRDITERKRMEEALHQTIREKEILLKEIHHRVKNNMQIISSILNLQAKSIKDPAALESLKMCQSRIRSMALIHEKLYRSREISRIDFGEYLRSLASALFKSFEADPDAVALKFETQDVVLDVNTAIPCGLIVNELILNAFKHAFPRGKSGEIRVALAGNGDGGYVLTVSDTGIGFPGDMDPGKAETLGFQLVNLLVEQIDGTLEVKRGNGTTFLITFREPHPKNGKTV